MKVSRFAVLAALLVCATTAGSQTRGPTWPMSDTAFLAHTDALARNIDDFMSRDMIELHVPGAVVAIVYQGQVVLLKGYGVENLESGKAVDPERTVFRVGSITKPFTATAIMQLYEQRRLSLHVDVNNYLRDLKVAATFHRPVTAADLLTHTAGLDVRLEGTAARAEWDVQPLGRFLSTHLPPRVRPPGNAIAYSNYGYTLLGYMIEQISGESYAAYMKSHVLDPLGMTSSSMTFGSDVEARSATGYEPRGIAGHRLAPPIHPNIVPAASLNTTALDMTKFMIAQLEELPAFAPNRVVGSAGRQLMQTPHFRQDPRMPGVTYGFFQSDWRNENIVFHSGGIRGFMSALYLWPDQRIGLFVADNGYRGDLEYDVLFHLMKRYIPGDTAVTLKPDLKTAPRIRKYAGFYRPTTQTRTNIEKGGGIRNAPLEIRATGKGSITAFGVEFVEIAPRYFREVHGYETLGFLEDDAGNPKAVVTTYPFPGTEVYIKVPFLLTAVPSQVVLITMLILGLAVLVRPPRIGEEKRWGQPSITPVPMVRWSKVTVPIARALAATQVAFLVLMWLGARTAGGMLYGVPWQMGAAGIVAIIGVVLLGLLIFRITVALTRNGWPRMRLAGLASFSVVSCLFVAVQVYWRLIGIQH